MWPQQKALLRSDLTLGQCNCFFPLPHFLLLINASALSRAVLRSLETACKLDEETPRGRFPRQGQFRSRTPPKVQLKLASPVPVYVKPDLVGNLAVIRETNGNRIGVCFTVSIAERPSKRGSTRPRSILDAQPDQPRLFTQGMFSNQPCVRNKGCSVKNTAHFVQWI